MKAYQHALDCSALQGSCREATEGFDAYGTNVRGGVMCRKGNSGCFRGCETPQALRASSPARRSSSPLASGFSSSSSLIPGAYSNLASGFCFFLGVVLFWLLFPARTMGQSVSPEQVDSLVKKVLAETRIDRERYKRVARIHRIDGVYRIPTPEEVWEHYQTVGPDSLLPYEYYVLLEMEESPAKKEALAKAAWENVTEPDGERPYALAAYELARCYLERGMVDTVLLKPYLNWYFIPNKEKIDFNGQSQGWFNDTAIVKLQMMMYCKAGNYQMADSVGSNLLPDIPHHGGDTFRGLENGNYRMRCGCEVNKEWKWVKRSESCMSWDEDRELLYTIRRFYKSEEECVDRRKYM